MKQKYTRIDPGSAAGAATILLLVHCLQSFQDFVNARRNIGPIEVDSLEIHAALIRHNPHVESGAATSQLTASSPTGLP
jgi:hypothetical protein